jgi:hypothetical protein
MKKLVAYLLVNFCLIVSCGKKEEAAVAAPACDSAYAGSFTGTSQADAFSATTACAFTYVGTGASCTSTGTYAAPIVTSGSMLVTISAVSGTGSCLPAGLTTCNYNFIDATHVVMNCGSGGALNYRKN